MKARPKPKSGDKNEFKRIECHFVNHVDALFMGILMCVSLLFGEDSEGSGTSGISPGGNSVSEEVLKHRSMVENMLKNRTY